MKWTTRVFSSVAVAALIAGCGGGRQGNDTGTAGAETETGTMQGDAGTTSDTAMTVGGDTGTTVGTDTAQGGARLQPDTNNPATGTDTVTQNPGDTARPSRDTGTTPGQ